MKLSDAKNKTLKLLDEYSSGGAVVTDADINLKMNDFFDNIQKHLCTIKPIIKVYTVPLVYADDDTYTEYPMPANFFALRQVWADLVPIDNATWRGKSIILPTNETRVIEIEYKAYPTTINSDTLDTYEFEIDQDAQELMPYWVASNHLVTDLMGDNQKLLAIYNQMLQALTDSLPKGAIKVVRLWL